MSWLGDSPGKASMRRNRIVGYALGILVIVSVFAYPLLRSPTSSIGDFVTLGLFCLFGIAVYVVSIRRSHREMDEVENRIATTPLESESRIALGVLRIAGYQLSFNQRRTFVGIVGISFLLCCANQLFDLGILGPFSKAALASSAIALFLAIRFVAPTVSEMQEHRAWRRTP